MIIEVYQYSYNTSEDGRGPTKYSNYFKNRNICEHASKGKGSWGIDGDVFPTKIIIDESKTIEEYELGVKEAEIVKILEKLTPEERELIKGRL